MGAQIGLIFACTNNIKSACAISPVDIFTNVHTSTSQIVWLNTGWFNKG